MTNKPLDLQVHITTPGIFYRYESSNSGPQADKAGALTSCLPSLPFIITINLLSPWQEDHQEPGVFSVLLCCHPGVNAVECSANMYSSCMQRSRLPQCRGTGLCYPIDGQHSLEETCRTVEWLEEGPTMLGSRCEHLIQPESPFTKPESHLEVAKLQNQS